MFTSLKPLFIFFLRPVSFFRNYSADNLRPDVIAGLTVAIILLPQAIAYALIVELPPAQGLYAAIVAAIVGALWGSCRQTHTGPTNAIALLLLAVLTSVGISPQSPEFLPAVALLAVMVGVFQVLMGLARLGVLVNFVSDSVIVGFTAGAGILIVVNQLRHLFGLDIEGSSELVETLILIGAHIQQTHLPSLLIGLATIVLMLVLQRFRPKWPGLLISMITASAIVAFWNLDEQGLSVIGQLPQNLPPFVMPPLLDTELISRLSTGAFAIASIGLVAAVSIGRSISSQTGQRLDSNQEFVGQGLANIAVGFFSGFVGAGSFARSAVNFKAGAKTQAASIFSAIFVLIAMLLIAPLAAYIPRASLAGALVIIGSSMVDRNEIPRILKGTRGDTLIMMATLLGTLFLKLEMAVLVGILISLIRYVMKTSVPKVFAVSPDSEYKHLVPGTGQAVCPQLGIIDILGDLYFGAINHVEEAIRQNLRDHPEQRFLLLRMRGVYHCDISGIHMLEGIMRTYREMGGDLYLMRVQPTVRTFMASTGFISKLGEDHFLPDDEAVTYLFYHVLDPAICIYECEVRAFLECQNLPKQTFTQPLPLYLDQAKNEEETPIISAQDLWTETHNPENNLLIIDVRETREFKQGHVPDAIHKPLSELITSDASIPTDKSLVLVCRSGRRSIRAAKILRDRGLTDIRILQGGLQAWETSGLLEAVEEGFEEEW